MYSVFPQRTLSILSVPFGVSPPPPRFVHNFSSLSRIFAFCTHTHTQRMETNKVQPPNCSISRHTHSRNGQNVKPRTTQNASESPENINLYEAGCPSIYFIMQKTRFAYFIEGMEYHLAVLFCSPSLPPVHRSSCSCHSFAGTSLWPLGKVAPKWSEQKCEQRLEEGGGGSSLILHAVVLLPSTTTTTKRAIEPKHK